MLKVTCEKTALNVVVALAYKSCSVWYRRQPIFLYNTFNRFGSVNENRDANLIILTI